MEKNVGKVDATIRIVIGIVALYLALVYSSWWFILVVIAFVTAFRKSCWLYNLLGINTAKVKQVAKKGKRK